MNDVDYKNDTNYIRGKCMDSYENLKRCNTFDDLLIQADRIFGSFDDNNSNNKSGNKNVKKDANVNTGGNS